MKLLLDTHAFIWWHSEPNKISEHALELIKNRSNTVWLSLASIWEIQIKRQLGKLSMEMPLDRLIETQQNINNIQMLPIIVNHILALENLPLHHKDPFDRILIAQAIVENAILISRDSIFSQYTVRTEW